MTLNFSTLRRPPNPQVVDPSTGRIREEWQLYFDQLTTRLNGAVGALATDPAPADAEYLVGAASAALSAERVVTDTTSIAWDLATAGQAKANVVAGSIGTTQIANDAVTYAKMQNVSATSRILGRKTAGAGDPEECTLSEILDFIGSAAQGDILYRGASAWARLGAGSVPQFLQTQGAGANPQWATAGWIKIGGTTASSSSSIDFTSLSSAYTALAIVISNLVPATAGGNLLLRTDENNGASFDAGATDYAYRYITAPDNVTTYTSNGSAGATAIQMADTLGNTGDRNTGGIIYIMNPSSSLGCLINWMISRVDNSGNFRTDIGGGWRNAVTTAVNAVRLIMSSGNITSGNFTLYGIPA